MRRRKSCSFGERDGRVTSSSTRRLTPLRLAPRPRARACAFARRAVNTRLRKEGSWYTRAHRYYKEWNAQFDYFHHTEGMSAFTLQGLAEPYDPKFMQRTKTYAAMYALSQLPPAQRIESAVEMSMSNRSDRCLLAAAGTWATTQKRQTTTRRRSSLDRCSQAHAVRCCAKRQAWTGQAIALYLLSTTFLLHANTAGKRVRAFLSVNDVCRYHSMPLDRCFQTTAVGGFDALERVALW